MIIMLAALIIFVVCLHVIMCLVACPKLCPRPLMFTFGSWNSNAQWNSKVSHPDYPRWLCTQNLLCSWWIIVVIKNDSTNETEPNVREVEYIRPYPVLLDWLLLCCSNGVCFRNACQAVGFYFYSRSSSGTCTSSLLRCIISISKQIFCKNKLVFQHFTGKKSVRNQDW